MGKIQKKGAGKIQKEGVGEIQKEGVGEIQKEGEGSGMGKGMRGKGKGLSGPVSSREGMQERTFSYTITITKTSCSEGSTQKSGPQIAWGSHKNKDTAQEQPLCRRNGRMY